MRSYTNIDTFWKNAIKDILNYGVTLESRAGACTEILDWSCVLENPRANFLFNPVRMMCPAYAAGELLWYLSGEANVEALLSYAPSYVRFTKGSMDEPNIAYGAYGPRIMRYLAQLIGLLRKDPNTRQAVLSLWSPDDIGAACAGGFADIPCTLSLTFNIREDRLHLSTTMRSNDVWLGTPYDVWCFTCLQQLIAEALDMELGSYTHHVVSMHLYHTNMDKAKRVINGDPYDITSLAWEHHVGNEIFKSMKQAVELERHHRELSCFNAEHTGAKLGPSSLLGQVCAMASLRVANNPKASLAAIDNNMLRKHCEKKVKQWVRS